MQDLINCSIVIPCYNSQNSIKLLVEEIFKLNLKKYKILEIICVDDFSDDNTSQILEELKTIHKDLIVINNSKNEGQVKATLNGIIVAKGDYIVTLDDDFQHPTSQIFKLLEACYEQNLDFTLGVWKLDENIIRNMSSLFANFLFKLISLDFTFFKFSAFRVINSNIKTKVVEEFQDSLMMDLRKISKKYKLILVQHNSKPLGRSYTSFSYRVQLAFKYIFNELRFKR